MEVSLDRLPGFAKDFVARLPGVAGSAAHIVGLSGNLGAGKTAFVQEVAKVLGVRTSVTSPTFVLAQRYPIHRPPFTHLIHIDAYRLSPEEKDTFGWKNYASDPQNLVFAEWPENLPGGKPVGISELHFEVTGENTRDITEHHGG